MSDSGGLPWQGHPDKHPSTEKPVSKLHPNRLSALRDRSRLTQAEVAKLLDIDETTVARHESGTRKLPHEMVEKYAKLYKVSSYELYLEPVKPTESTAPKTA
ncbi:hypothetical protein LCGC14_1954320 [marine sediment metagenome]|uniref:HTH cro/C1-type domain-containing protein n=1 Tax=marine sediment metagenome TaxID=412755 RepID=A0A0F9G4U9_9ZZZZ